MTTDTKPMSPAALRKLLGERDRFWRALHTISKYMPARELETKSERVYGLPPDQATEYAYENVLNTAPPACEGVRRGTQGFRPAASAAHARPSSGGVLTRRHWPMVLGATPSTSAARRSDRPMWVSQASNRAGVIMGCGRPIQRLRGAAAECGQAGRPG